MLTIRKGKVVKQSRIAPERNDDADHFCQVFDELVTSFPVSEATLHNLDGIRLAMDRDRTMRTSVVAVNDRLRGNVTLAVHTTTLTAIPIVSAAGECLAVYIIVQNPGSSSSGAASSEEGAERGGDEVELDVVLDVPPIGRVTRFLAALLELLLLEGDHWILGFRDFLQHPQTLGRVWQEAHPGIYTYIVTDRLHAHVNRVTVSMLAGKHVLS